MAKHIEQVAGTFTPYTELMNFLGSEAKHITKIGLQLPGGSYAIIDGKEFEIGKTGILEFEDVQISSVKFRSHNANTRQQMYVIMDCVYDDAE